MSRPLPAVQLRVPTDEDALAWHRIFADPEVMEFHGVTSAELSVYEELTARQRRHDAERGFCLWTMLDVGTRQCFSCRSRIQRWKGFRRVLW